MVHLGSSGWYRRIGGDPESRSWEEKISQIACCVSERGVWDGTGELGIGGVAMKSGGKPLAGSGARVGWV